LRGTNRVDIDGDGRKDFILWQTFVGLDPRTDIYVFLRGSNGLLPEQPTQIVHGRGFPIPIGSTVEPAPVADLKSDGSCELVLMQPKTAFTSASSIVDMVLSGGMEFELTIRSFNGGAFAGTPNAIIPITTILPITSVAPAEEMIHWPFFICGDFNGDGRPDLVVRHSATQWSISFSTNDGHWFAPQPAMAFDTPVQEFLDLSDLNGDGRADIVLREESDPRIFIFLSKSKP
jgi:hypothetical protein